MKFVNEEAVLMEVFLDEQRDAGKHWVAFDETIPRLAKDDLTCFASLYEAKEYCYEQSIGDIRYKYCTIDRLQQALERAVKTGIRRKA